MQMPNKCNMQPQGCLNELQTAKGHLKDYIFLTDESIWIKNCYLLASFLVSVSFHQILMHLHLISSEIIALLLITAVINCHLIDCLKFNQLKFSSFIRNRQMISSVLSLMWFCRISEGVPSLINDEKGDILMNISLAIKKTMKQIIMHRRHYLYL